MTGAICRGDSSTENSTRTILAPSPLASRVWTSGSEPPTRPNWNPDANCVSGVAATAETTTAATTSSTAKCHHFSERRTWPRLTEPSGHFDRVRPGQLVRLMMGSGRADDEHRTGCVMGHLV